MRYILPNILSFINSVAFKWASYAMKNGDYSFVEGCIEVKLNLQLNIEVR